MTEQTPDQRAENTKEIVSHIVHRKTEDMFNEFDRLHRRGIHDDDVVAALRSLHEMDLLDSYAEWGDIDIREDDNITTNPDGVTDPGNNPSDLDRIHTETVQAALHALIEGMKEQVVKDRTLWFDYNHVDEVVVDGNVDFLALAQAVVKGLGK